jgi:hypothetical protein
MKTLFLTASLTLSTLIFLGCQSTTNSQSSDMTKAESIKNEILSAPVSTLTQETKDTLSYMGNEERLAYDMYNYLYDYHLKNSAEDIKQLTNIATNAEYVHIQTVQLLVQKYITSDSEFTNVDLNENNYKETPVEDMNAGVYDISAIQNLYDLLASKGVQSKQDALEVGCMVEVTDIDDLDKYILIAQDSNANDVVDAFEFLRDGSYSHYWAFDSGLKNMGVSDGCCVLGDEYCHDEYPNSSNGNSKGKGK